VGSQLEGTSRLSNAGVRNATTEGYYRALTIYKGKLEWVGHGAEYTETLDKGLFSDMAECAGDFWGLSVYMQWHRLSAYGGRHAHRGGRSDESEPVCPTCHLALPRSGTCDNCGEAL
jgi:hypothetical protein